MVKHNNQWGTVCDDSILPGDGIRSVRAARSACHTLGLSGGVIEAYNKNTQGPAGPIWFNNIDCASNSENFLRCPHTGLPVTNCNHGEDAVLTCT